jgi:hypothetical protein
MFIVDEEGKSTVIMTVDAGGIQGDIEVILDEGEVTIRQWDEDWRHHNLMVMSRQQLDDIMAAVNGRGLL